MKPERRGMLRSVLRPTTAVYPALGLITLLSALLSSRGIEASGMIRDRVFPLIELTHAPGAGTFLPGSFALNFFLPSFSLMAFLNLLQPQRFAPLTAGGAKVFAYLLLLMISIVEIGADILIPMAPLASPWAFRGAVTLVHACFAASLLLAITASKGAEKAW